MARLTAQDMVSIIRDICGGETSETLTDTRILRFINEAYLSLVSKYCHDQLSTSTTISTSSGTATYELSVSDVVEFTDLVNDTKNFKLYPMSEMEYHRFTQGDAQSGDPVFWYIDGVGDNDRYQIRLWPTPISSDTIYVYYTKLEELVLDPTPTSAVVPRVWDKVIYLYAAASVWEMLGDDDKADRFLQMAARNEGLAAKTVHIPSKIGQTLPSFVGSALRYAR